MRRFELQRDVDISGVSGTGVVAQGVIFDDGSVAVRWLGDYPSTAVWEDIDLVMEVHGHNGCTHLIMLDDE